MNLYIFKGQWELVQRDVRQRWTSLTEDDINSINGDYDRLIECVRLRYSMAREDAEMEVNRVMDKM